MPEIHRLVLTFEERRGEEVPVPVARIEWTKDDLPSRSYFMAAVRTAYESIELPYFPAAAWVEITTPFLSERVAASEPEDEAMVAAGLWDAIVVTTLGYDSSN